VTSKDNSFSSSKQQVSLNLSMKHLSFIRQKAEAEEVTVNEAVRDIMTDYFHWYALPEPVVEVLKADAKKHGRDTSRDYVVELLMKRYTELVFEQQSADKKK